MEIVIFFPSFSTYNSTNFFYYRVLFCEIKNINIFLKFCVKVFSVLKIFIWLSQVLAAACGIQFPDQGWHPGLLC